MAPLLLFLLMAVSHYPAHAAPASPEPPTTEPSESPMADSYPTPLVQLGSSIPLSVPSLPYIDYVRYGRLQNIQSLNYTDIIELYRTAMEIVQTLTHLSGVMVSIW